MWTEQFGDTSIRGRQGSGASEVDTVAVMVTYSGDDHVWQTVTGLGLRWWSGGQARGHRGQAVADRVCGCYSSARSTTGAAASPRTAARHQAP